MLPPVTCEPLSKSQPVAVAALGIVRAAVERVETHWQAVLDADDAAGPHQLRVALRKLRVVLQIFRDKAETEDATQLRKSLGRTARKVGRLRDLDMLMEDIVAPCLAAEKTAGGEALLAQLAIEREAARMVVRRYLTSTTARRLRATLSTLPERRAAHLDATRPELEIGKLARRNLKRRWRRICRKAAELDTCSEDVLHDVRKELKNLRYAFALFASFWGPRAAGEFDAQVRRLQATFGYLNDVASARSLSTRIRLGAEHQPANDAIGATLAWHEDRARQSRGKISRQWDALVATKIAKQLGK